MVLTLLGAIWLLERAQAENRASAAWGSAALLGMSAAFKIVPLALVPVWFFALGWRRAWWTLPVVVAVPVGLAAWYGFPAVPVFGALGRFGRDFPGQRRGVVDRGRVGAAGRGLGAGGGGGDVRSVGGVVAAGLAAGGAVGDGGGVVAQPRGARVVRGVGVAAGGVARGTAARAWFVWSVSVFGYFLLWEVNHDSGRPWEEPLWLRGLIYLPPLAAWVGINARGRDSEAK